MGEYWKPVNVTTKEYIHPHALDCGLKLPEWHYPKSAVRRRIDELIVSGRWSCEHDIRAVSDWGNEIQLYGKPGEEHVGYGEIVDGFADVSDVPAPPEAPACRPLRK